MHLVLYSIIAIQVVVILTLISNLTKSLDIKKPYKVEYKYIPNISEVIGSDKKYDVSGSWISETNGTTLDITSVDDDKLNITLTKSNNVNPGNQLKGSIDHYNGVVYINQPVDLGDPYYGDEHATPVMMLILDPHLEDKLIDPIAGSLYQKNPAAEKSGNTSARLSGKWKDVMSTDIMDINVTDYVIKGRLANNDILGFINPTTMYFVVFLKGIPVPGYFDDNTFYVQLNNINYKYSKI